MKIIFLDIDGVLNTGDTFNKSFYNSYVSVDYSIEVDKFRLEYLKEIIDSTGAKIVLISSFRHFFEKENGVIVPRNLKGKKLYDLFQKYGITIYDTTPNTIGNREEQIKTWLSNNDVESFVIIDDDPSMFRELYDKLILTSRKKRSNILMDLSLCTGLCEYHVSDVISVLNSKKKSM